MARRWGWRAPKRGLGLLMTDDGLALAQSQASVRAGDQHCAWHWHLWSVGPAPAGASAWPDPVQVRRAVARSGFQAQATAVAVPVGVPDDDAPRDSDAVGVAVPVGAADGDAEGAMAAMADMQRAGRVRGDELHNRALAAALLAVLLVLRTQKPAWRSRPGLLLWTTTLAVAAVALACRPLPLRSDHEPTVESQRHVWALA